MNLKIDENKLPIKFILENYYELPNFPDEWDILYLYIKDAQLNPDNSKNLNFTRHSIEKYKAPGRNDQIESGLKRAIELGWIEELKHYKNETYKIIKNPYE